MSTTMKQVRMLEVWLKHRDVLLKDWGLAKKVKLGYSVLFHGPPGTGKTLTASILGKSTGREVYRVDLSVVASKFIGETEKNLNQLFEKAQAKDWILYFDEADAMFGKRTEMKVAYDRYANVEISYLLQKMDSYTGLIICSTNKKGNIVEAFIRRFQANISFPLPKEDERLRLWQKIIPEEVKLAESIDMQQVSAEYELTGAQITNVIQAASLQAGARHEATITRHDLLEGIRIEYELAGKALDDLEER
ncbi:ATP-binding protein [Pontibacter toksunensis]|uniref:ATP-binding protein n=1 Tax=Pontibacter toksunensis TaxID=1332631 RepID=A0ABW6BZQ0_9BACT